MVVLRVFFTEAHEGDACWISISQQVAVGVAEGDPRGTLFGKAIDAGADRRNGEVLNVVLHSEGEELHVAGGEERVGVGVAELCRVVDRGPRNLLMFFLRPYRSDGVEDVLDALFFKGECRGAFGKTRRAAAKGFVVFEQLWSCSTVDRTIDTSAAQ